MAELRTRLAKQKSTSKCEAAVGGNGIDIGGSNASAHASQCAGKK